MKAVVCRGVKNVALETVEDARTRKTLRKCWNPTLARTWLEGSVP